MSQTPPQGVTNFGTRLKSQAAVIDQPPKVNPSPLFSTISTTANGDIGQTQPITNGGQQIVAQPRRGILNAKSNKDLLPSIGQSKLPEKHVTFSSDAETFRIPKGQPSSISPISLLKYNLHLGSVYFRLAKIKP